MHTSVLAKVLLAFLSRLSSQFVLTRLLCSHFELSPTKLKVASLHTSHDAPQSTHYTFIVSTQYTFNLLSNFLREDSDHSCLKFDGVRSSPHFPMGKLMKISQAGEEKSRSRLHSELLSKTRGTNLDINQHQRRLSKLDGSKNLLSATSGGRGQLEKFNPLVPLVL
jgi:hypothetical protein